MRRLLATGVLVAGLWSAAGCAGDPPGADVPETTTPSAAGTATTAGAGTAGGGNTPAVCAAAQEAGATGIRTYVEEVGRMVAAVGANDSATAEAARQRAEAALVGWRSALRQQSAEATDPELRTLLSDMSTEVDAMGADVAAIDETELDRLQQRLDQLCPR
ncbi:hypothetical protein [Micromonospora sp. WMMD812]|uniref:hypothetical protein n=1 Tax=Micromonospora sp. WMMD812 TaxID=3015152 RepID=UPI00248CC13B|nr:hypothetical protein [Micromonospora sp. WMMD812]WBB66887.1 hypothetical protein O7603_27795 [Micromonospora sp. WMMD812]